MAKKLPTPTQNSKVVLNRARKLINITNKILSKENRKDQDDNWIYRLWKWADENGIPDLEWVENNNYDEGGYWRGLPRDKKKLLNLTKLNLSKNKLTKLSKEIGNLTNLTILLLGDNKLTELPKEIANLTNLANLSLSNNQLTKLPKEIGNLTNLSMLSLWNNQLIELPKEIVNLTNLTVLDLVRNQLTKLPKKIVNLTNLTELGLKYNPNLILTKEQKQWVITLKEKGCKMIL